MSITGSPYLGSLVASGNGDGGGPPLLMIFLVVMGALVVASLLAGARPTVVVVERPVGLLTTVFVLAGGLGLLYLLAHVPASTF